MPNKNPWESYNPACEYQNYATMNVLESDTKDSLEMTPAEWEKCVNLPLDVQEGDFQTEVWMEKTNANERKGGEEKGCILHWIKQQTFLTALAYISG